MNIILACTQVALPLLKFMHSRSISTISILVFQVSIASLSVGQSQEAKLQFTNPESAIVFSVISDRHHNEAREFRFGTGPNTGFVRPFAFSSDSQLFLYGLNGQCFVMGSKDGRNVWATFSLKHKRDSSDEERVAPRDARIRVAALDGESYRAFLACKNDRLFRVDFADLEEGNSKDTVRFLPKPKIESAPQSVPNYMHVEKSGQAFAGSAFQPYQLWDRWLRTTTFERTKYQSSIDHQSGTERFMGRQHVAHSQDGEFLALLAERDPNTETENMKPRTNLTLLENRQGSWVESEQFRTHLMTGEISQNSVSALAFSPTQPRLILALGPTNFGGGYLIPMKTAPFGANDSAVDANNRGEQKLILLNFESAKLIKLSPYPFEPFNDKEVRFISWSYDATYLTIVSTPDSNGTSSVTILQEDDGGEKPDRWRKEHHWKVKHLQDVAVSPADNRIALVNQAGVLEVYSMKERTLLTRIQQDEGSMLMFSPDGMQLACYSENGRLTVYDIEDLCTRKKFTTGR